MMLGYIDVIRMRALIGCVHLQPIVIDAQLRLDECDCGVGVCNIFSFRQRMLNAYAIRLILVCKSFLWSSMTTHLIGNRRMKDVNMRP